MPVILELGLLLQEYWRAVEVEADDFNTLNFLQESVLTVQTAEEVVTTIKEVFTYMVTVAAEIDRVEIIKGGHGEELRKREQKVGKGESEERIEVSEEKKVVEEQEEEMRASSRPEEVNESKKEKEKEGREEKKPKRRGRKHCTPVQAQ